MEYGTVQNVIEKLEELGYENATYSYEMFYFENPVSHVTLGYDKLNKFHINFESAKMSPQGLTIFVLQANRVAKHVEELNKLL